MADQANVRPFRDVLRTAQTGSRRDLLVALRERLWTALQDDRTQPRDLSPLTLRIKELHAEIAEIDDEETSDRHLAARDEPFTPYSI